MLAGSVVWLILFWLLHTICQGRTSGKCSAKQMKKSVWGAKMKTNDSNVVERQATAWSSKEWTNKPSSHEKNCVWFMVQVLWKLQTCSRHLKNVLLFPLWVCGAVQRYDVCNACMHLWVRKMLSVVFVYQWHNFEFVMFWGSEVAFVWVWMFCYRNLLFSLFFFLAMSHRIRRLSNFQSLVETGTKGIKNGTFQGKRKQANEMMLKRT